MSDSVRKYFEGTAPGQPDVLAWRMSCHAAGHELAEYVEQTAFPLAGKTVLELFLLAMAMKYGITAVLYDKDRGTEIAIRAMGGIYTVFRRGEPTGLNPFQLEPDEAVLDFWERLVRKLVDSGSPLSAKDS